MGARTSGSTETLTGRGIKSVLRLYEAASWDALIEVVNTQIDDWVVGREVGNKLEGVTQFVSITINTIQELQAVEPGTVRALVIYDVVGETVALQKSMP